MDAIERYFHESGDTPSRLAGRIGRSPSTITRVINGQREPSFDLAREIERGTEGKLAAGEFLQACLERKSSPVVAD